MVINGYTIGLRLIAGIVGLLLIIGLVSFGVRSCDKRRAAATQARVDSSQAGAAQDSAKDAIGTVARSGEAQAASEDLTRSNERDIRAAEGASVQVSPQVQAAGLRSLCARAAYKAAPRCAPFRGDSR